MTLQTYLPGFKDPQQGHALLYSPGLDLTLCNLEGQRHLSKPASFSSVAKCCKLLAPREFSYKAISILNLR